MYVYLLLVAAGGCWVGGVAGAILWWNARRGGVNASAFAGSRETTSVRPAGVTMSLRGVTMRPRSHQDQSPVNLVI